MAQIFLIIVFAVAHVLLLGHIHLFGMVMPLLYVYYVILFPRKYPIWLQLPLCFLMGLFVDIFNNTPGLSAASLTLVGFVQPYLLGLYLKKEEEQNFRPSIASMGFMKFTTYALLLTLLFCLTYFTLEIGSYYYWLEWVEACFGSLLLTLLLIVLIDSMRGKR